MRKPAVSLQVLDFMIAYLGFSNDTTKTLQEPGQELAAGVIGEGYRGGNRGSFLTVKYSRLAAAPGRRQPSDTDASTRACATPRSLALRLTVAIFRNTVRWLKPSADQAKNIQ